MPKRPAAKPELDESWDVEIQGHTHRMTCFGAASCAGRNGVGVEMTNTRGAWVIPIESLRRMVAEYEASSLSRPRKGVGR